jgi:cytochrome c-type biogenesis protein
VSVEFAATSFALGYAAGVLSTLSPCVVPLLPILVASALAQHRLGLWALAAGMALSFTLVGLFIASVGAGLGIDSSQFHMAAGVLLIAFGAVMATPRLQAAFANATSFVGAGGDRVLGRVAGRGWRGQFAVGGLLGVVWTPCVGPTLGAASTLAAQSSRLVEVALLMLVFGIGAATPLLAVGILSRRLALGTRAAWLHGAQAARRVLGILLVAAGALIVTGADKRLEAFLVDASPAWLTELTTRF